MDGDSISSVVVASPFDMDENSEVAIDDSLIDKADFVAVKLNEKAFAITYAFVSSITLIQTDKLSGNVEYAFREGRSDIQLLEAPSLIFVWV